MSRGVRSLRPVAVSSRRSRWRIVSGWQRLAATTYEFATSHVPMVSRPDLVLDVVRTAANAVQQSLAIA